MADIDVNTDDGFAAALREAAQTGATADEPDAPEYVSPESGSTLTPEIEEPDEDEDPGDEPDDLEDEDDGEEEGHELLAGRFKSPEDLAKSYLELERALGEQGQKIGQRHAEERAQMRAELDFMRSQLAALSTQRPQPQHVDDETIETWVESNPEQAALRALQTGDNDLYDRVIEAWADVEAGAAVRFASKVEAARARQEIQRELASLRQDNAGNRVESAFNEAFIELAATLPDFNDRAQAIIDKAAELKEAGLPELEQAITSGDAPKVKAALRALHGMVAPAALPEAAKEKIREEADKRQAAKAKARLARSSAAPGHAGMSVEQQIEKSLLESGLNIDADLEVPSRR